jgi:hypothetical protein
MNSKFNRGFGVGTLVVIIAIVLIVGGYMYYRNQPAQPATETPASTDTTGTVVDTSVTGTMETGTTGTPAN